nr:PREDICTED: LOW QUALITY PROTEIN: taste receptor type 1 member 1 [Struthio camelus australis]
MTGHLGPGEGRDRVPGAMTGHLGPGEGRDRVPGAMTGHLGPGEGRDRVPGAMTGHLGPGEGRDRVPGAMTGHLGPGEGRDRVPGAMTGHLGPGQGPKPPRIFQFTPDNTSVFVQCSAFQSHGYHLFQTMKFTVQDINNSSTLLPNITLGYDIYDTCSESANIYATYQGLLAVVGPDSTKLALTTAPILSVFLILEVSLPQQPLQISYEASVEKLSLKRLYPSFLRTVPSDRQQVKAIVLLLQRFGWTWVALLGNDNTYGRSGLEALHELLSANDICIAYQGIIPSNKDASSPQLHDTVRVLTDIRVNATIIFSSKQIARPFFEVVVQENITGMVWALKTALAQTVWHVPGIQNIGSVIGLSIKQTESMTLKHSESWKKAEERASSTGAGGGNGGSSRESAQLNCTQGCTGCQLLTTAPDEYDTKASYSTYTAVYAVAHGLHARLGCASGACSKGRAYPWQVRATQGKTFLPLWCGFSP